ncbi:hypothetical protein SEA_WEASELS2_169 [Rhodococcus phage Weasels2]|uniref:Uncharacterized protein n=1 Tax=Rhodococcus phage Weasels2 TaxID=1897437 RepID=A0A1I9SAE2_9CAUD|nr:hypothetical protein FDH04_gp246 [Rhodococcus phage Weasels2]AOZ63748.1 hypothetical protein SEA_WEASELS2_169 [Rhodococcus phage Weasels2]
MIVNNWKYHSDICDYIAIFDGTNWRELRLDKQTGKMQFAKDPISVEKVRTEFEAML